MDTWIVGRKPVGVYEFHASTDVAASPKVRLI